ncbi:MAG TPA: DUF998 domain-containing protein [Polyangia bacterium]|nr:DUF998 domain-containing protein [Polyangia bacterium]
MNGQRPWQRIVLLVVLAFEGAGGLAGGSLLVARPDGHLMGLPLTLMHGAFPDFLIPGVVLFGLGLLNAAAFVAVMRKIRTDWLWASLASGGFAIWFLVEILVVRELHWLQVMWGFPVIAGLMVTPPLLPLPRAVLRDVALACGPASSLLYAAMNVFVARQWPAYDSASQTISELSAVGAPTRPLWVVVAIFDTLLVIAFGFGVRMAADRDRRLRFVGTLLVVYGALGLLWPFAPMHLREVLAAGGSTFTDKVHVSLAGVTVVIYLVALGVAAAALGRAFRVYSVATLAALLACAARTFKEAPLVGLNQPTPLIGVWERINVGLFLLWVIVVAAALLARSHARQAHA